MNIEQALTLREMLEVNWPLYLRYLSDGGERMIYTGNRSGNWQAGSLVRASYLGKGCAKRIAAEQLGLTNKEEFGYDNLLRFDDAIRRAEQVYEAIAWTLAEHNQVQRRVSWSAVAEYRTKNAKLGLAGTIDMLITGRFPQETEIFPVEVKHTRVRFGISFLQMLQTVGYMKLLTTDTYRCQYGYVFTTYDWDHRGRNGEVEIGKVWLVAWDEALQGYRLWDAKGTVCAPENSDFRTLPGQQIFIAEAWLDALIAEHHDWLKALSSEANTALEAEGPITDPFSGQICATWTVPELYQRKSGSHQKGDRKFGTGEMTGLCPLFGRCHRTLLEASGYNVAELSEPILLKQTGEQITFEEGEYAAREGTGT